MIATNNKRINAFAERLIDRIANDGPPKSQMPDGSYEVDIWSEEDFIRIIREEAAKPEWQEPNIERMMSLSTEHLSQDAMDWLDACGEANISNFPHGGPISTLGRTEYGYFMHAPDIMGGSNPQGMPASLRAICAYVRDHDCAYVLFDTDADGVEDLPTFEMDEREGPRPGVALDDGGGLADELIEPEAISIPPLRPRTDLEIVQQTNDLAIRALGWLFGVAAPKDWKCYEARDPRSKKAWGVACEIQEFMTATDPNDALSNIEE